MTRQQEREEWVRLNTCSFCIGSHLHTCTGYRCEPAIEQAKQYYDEIIMRKKEMKTIYVRTDTLKEATKCAMKLYTILRDYTPVIADLHRGRKAVQTKNTYVRYISEQQNIDGLTCDIPVGFGQQGKIMAKGKEYPKLHSLKDIAKYIVKEELK